MKRLQFVLAVLAAGVAVGVFGGRILNAEESSKAGTLIKRTDLVSAKGMEAVLVLHEMPAGGESGKHTQGSNEVVYILEGSVVLEVEGQPAVTLKAGEAFSTSVGEVHNVKNASAEAPAKALAFYVAKKDTPLEKISTQVK